MAGTEGFFISQKLAIVLGCVFVGSLVIVGVAVGVSSRNNGTSEGEKPATAAPTAIPTASTAAPTSGPTSGPCPWCNLLIPQDIYIPEKYDLTLEPDLEPEKDNLFSGTVVATVKVLKPTSVFMIHIKDLNVTETKLSGGHKVKKAFPYEENQFWVIQTEADVPVGSLDLTLIFKGYLTHGIVGFYKSTYKDKSGKVHALATSKFEPSDARKAFPCFDEPNLKAKYTVNLIYKKVINGNDGYYALSNMPADGEPQDLGNGKYKQKFQESVKMSTYLACFIVCDFEKKSKKTKAGKDFSVYAPRGTLDQALYSLDIGVTITNYYEDFFQIEYPLPKQDMIAIPDFPSGAMEHWGLITYRMTSMLYDEKMASLKEKQRVTTVVAHELAHMWFGNLVTMDWWDDLWLNEGFASFVEYLGTNKAEPDYKVLDQFLATDMQGVLEMDSTKASHPIITKVDSPNQVTELFDAITYQKGCSVIRMLESYLGQDDFRNGVTLYLNNHKWGNAKNADLWKAMSEKSKANVDVGALMDAWTKKPHYPLVTVEEVTESGGKTKVKVNQEIFLLNNDGAKDTLWQVPIMAFGSDGSATSDSTFLLKTKADEFELPGSASSFLKLNKGQFGFYRVLYPDAQWTKLTETLKTSHEALAAVDRAGILDDAFNLARAGKMSYEKALTALEYLGNEKGDTPWNIANDALDYITDNYGGPEQAKWRTFVSKKAGKVLQDISLTEDSNDSFSTKTLRPTIISLACRHGNSDCLAQSLTMFNEWLKNTTANPINVNVRAQIYKYGMSQSGEKEWNAVHALYKKTTVPQEQKKLRLAMSMPKSPWILRRYIDYAKDKSEGFKGQDYFTIMEYIANNPVGLPVAWEYIKSHWEELVARFKISDRYFGRMIKRVISHFNTEFQLQDVEAFFKAYPEAGAGERARAEGLTNIRDNIAWRNKFENSLTNWLKNLKM